jgi:DNA-directed RNA polymerase specialized sigma24 family protein
MSHPPLSTPRRPGTALDALARYRSAAPGKRGAQDDLVRALSPIVQRTVAGRMRRRARAGRAVDQEIEDLVQTVLLAIFAEKGGPLDAWDPSRGLDLPAFVAFVTARKVDSVLRSRRRNPWTEEPVAADALPEGSAPRVGVETLAGSRRLLLTVAARLREQTAPVGYTIFEMLFLQERTPAEVACALGLGVPAVYTWKSRLSSAARAIVAEIEGEPQRD